MLTSRGWLVALAVTSLVVLAVPIALAAPERLIAVAVIDVTFAVLLLLVRSRLAEGNAWAIALTVAAILYASALTGLLAPLATVQFFVYPLAWVLAGSVRAALVASGAIAAGVGIGFLVSLGTSPEAIVQTLITQVLAFGFSAMMGLWIARIAAIAEEKARLLDELTAAQDALAVANRDTGIAEERGRLAREVHDTVAQSLTALVLLGQRARRDFARGALDAETLELIETSARDALAEARALVVAAAPVELDHGGIASALATLGERFQRETRIRVTTGVDIASPIPRDAEVVLLRCAQEGLANVRKHSEAEVAHVTLDVAHGSARLRVSDDGRGFPEGWSPGFGLSGLRDRLALAGGALDVASVPGRTELTATVPIGGAA